jgi:hypothetical protein
VKLIWIAHALPDNGDTVKRAKMERKNAVAKTNVREMKIAMTRTHVLVMSV